MRKPGLIAAVIALAISTIAPAHAAQTDGDLFVVNYHHGYVDWYWKSPPSSPVTSYTVAIDNDPALTFDAADNFFVPADHQIPNPELRKLTCVNAKMADGWGFGRCVSFSSEKNVGQVIAFSGGPSSIYKADGHYLDSIGYVPEPRDSQPKGVNGRKFYSADSVFLSTNVYFFQPPYISKVYVCDLKGKCVDDSKPVPGYWNGTTSPIYTTAKVSTPDVCTVLSTQGIEGAQYVQEVKPLRDNIDCEVVASSHVPFLDNSDITAKFSIHFQKLRPSALLQLPIGELNPTVGNVTALTLQQIPKWDWLQDRRFSLAASSTDALKLSKENKSLTPRICSIKPEPNERLGTLNIKGLAAGQCQIEISVPASTSNDEEKRVLTFKVTKPRVNSSVYVSKYPCMVVDPGALTFTVYNVASKSAAPKNCQAKNAYIS